MAINAIHIITNVLRVQTILTHLLNYNTFWFVERRFSLFAGDIGLLRNI